VCELVKKKVLRNFQNAFFSAFIDNTYYLLNATCDCNKQQNITKSFA